MARAKKRYGQHFLQPVWADKVVQAIAPAPGDRFLEIGPGPGALTMRLAPKVAEVTAVEVDRELVAELSEHLPVNTTLVQQDFLEFDISSLGSDPWRVAGNLPYNLTSPILFRILDARRRGIALTDATLMMQREVADRIEAGPGTKDYGTLSIFVQLRARTRRMLTLPPGAFRPAPKVHSAVVRLEFHEPAVAMRDEATFEALVRSIFMQRRKTLANALDRFATARSRHAREAIAEVGLDGMRRPETLQLTELARLADVFSSQSAPPVL